MFDSWNLNFSFKMRAHDKKKGRPSQKIVAILESYPDADSRTRRGSVLRYWNREKGFVISLGDDD